MTESALNNEHVKRGGIHISTPPPPQESNKDFKKIYLPPSKFSNRMIESALNNEHVKIKRWYQYFHSHSKNQTRTFQKIIIL